MRRDTDCKNNPYFTISVMSLSLLCYAGMKVQNCCYYVSVELEQLSNALLEVKDY